MKKIAIIIFISLNTQIVNAQTFTMQGSEIGFDLAFSASTFGGNAGLGLKYGLNFGENIILGPFSTLRTYMD